MLDCQCVRVYRNTQVVSELSKWNMEFAPELEKIRARQLPQEAILMTGNGRDVAVSLILFWTIFFLHQR